MCQNLEKLAGLFWNENATSKFKCDFFSKRNLHVNVFSNPKNQAQGPVWSAVHRVHADVNNSRNFSVKNSEEYIVQTYFTPTFPSIAQGN